MRKSLWIVPVTVVALGFLVAPAVAAKTQLKGGVFSPEFGVICDKDIFCADEQGISMGMTKMYLGEMAEKKLLEKGEFDTTRFTLTNGVYCEVKIRKCTISKYEDKLDVAHTKALFGPAGLSDAAAAPTNAVYSPDSGILCDKLKGFCADAEGISMTYTEEYLGEDAQRKQMALMKKGGSNQTFFVLSNGIACNTADRKCYAGEYDNRVDDGFTKILFDQ